MLYFDPRLSQESGSLLQLLPHARQVGVDDDAPRRTASQGQRASATPAHGLQAAGHIVQFWDGRAAERRGAGQGPHPQPVEMAMPNEKAVVEVLNSMPEYAGVQEGVPRRERPGHLRQHGEGHRRLRAQARHALALGQVTSTATRSSLTGTEKAGFNQFVSSGLHHLPRGRLPSAAPCTRKLGLVKPYPDTKDPGRFKVTKNDADKMMFKVPTPAQRRQDRALLPRRQGEDPRRSHQPHGRIPGRQEAAKEEVKSIAAFLDTLTGEVPKSLTSPPKLPASTAKTPKPVMTD